METHLNKMRKKNRRRYSEEVEELLSSEVLPRSRRHSIRRTSTLSNCKNPQSSSSLRVHLRKPSRTHLPNIHRCKTKYTISTNKKLLSTNNHISRTILIALTSMANHHSNNKMMLVVITIKTSSNTNGLRTSMICRTTMKETTSNKTSSSDSSQHPTTLRRSQTLIDNSRKEKWRTKGGGTTIQSRTMRRGVSSIMERRREITCSSEMRTSCVLSLHS
jgi:hypothetical protein